MHFMRVEPPTSIIFLISAGASFDSKIAFLTILKVLSNIGLISS